MMGQCANIIAVSKYQQSYEILNIAENLSVMKIMLLKEDGMKTKPGCCVIEFASYKEVLLKVLLNDTHLNFSCDIVIVVWKNVQSLQLSTKKNKRSVKHVLNSVNDHKEVTEGNKSFSGAIFENSTVRMTRAANGSYWRMSPKLNETDWEKIRQRLAIQL